METPSNDSDQVASSKLHGRLASISGNNGRWHSDPNKKRRMIDLSQPRRHLSIRKWGLILSLWSLSILATAWFSGREGASPFSYETGFDTDLQPIRPFIELKRVKFTGGIKFDENGTTYRAVDPEAVQYVGEPSETIDRAWRQLIRGEGVDLIEEEAKSVVGKTYQKSGVWWQTGADVFHQLHCINLLRTALRPDYYKPLNPEPLHTEHLYHCIDYLRQGVMCSADLTPLPFEWADIRGRIIQIQEVVHTCRNFDKIHEWSLARNSDAHKV
ncbi:hypothetical protein F5884DRAFT_859837 [Xylogone sp. PMI_703]|nr:hypothetical protein F5884DRAFT_859837 [Xylogone sp. PMI_703]